MEIMERMLQILPTPMNRPQGMPVNQIAGTSTLAHGIRNDHCRADQTAVWSENSTTQCSKARTQSMGHDSILNSSSAIAKCNAQSGSMRGRVSVLKLKTRLSATCGVTTGSGARENFPAFKLQHHNRGSIPVTMRNNDFPLPLAQAMQPPME